MLLMQLKYVYEADRAYNSNCITCMNVFRNHKCLNKYYNTNLIY